MFGASSLVNRRGSGGGEVFSQGRGQESVIWQRAHLQIGAVGLGSSSYQLLPLGHDKEACLGILGNLLSKPVHLQAERLGGKDGVQSWRDEPIHPTLLRTPLEPTVTCVSRLWLDLKSGTQVLVAACPVTQFLLSQ